MDIQTLSDEMDRFVRSKGWYEDGSLRPQTPRSIAISLCLEAAEVLEHFQWNETSPQPDELSGELADVTLYLLQLARIQGIDLEAAVIKKLQTNYQRSWDGIPGDSL